MKKTILLSTAILCMSCMSMCETDHLFRNTIARIGGFSILVGGTFVTENVIKKFNKGRDKLDVEYFSSLRLKYSDPILLRKIQQMEIDRSFMRYRCRNIPLTIWCGMVITASSLFRVMIEKSN